MRLQTIPRIPRIPRPVVVVPPTVQQKRTLKCDTCDNWTPHALTNSQAHYVCGMCGTQIIHIVNNAPAMWAIR